MKISKIKKLPMIFTLMLALAISLVGASNAFAYNEPGPNGEYCAIIYQSQNGDAYNSTPSNPIDAVKNPVETNIIGTTGSLPLTLKYSNGCRSYQIVTREIDSAGNEIGNLHISPIIAITGEGTPYGPNTQFAHVPAEWFVQGKLYEVYSFGMFPGVVQSPSSTAYYRILN